MPPLDPRSSANRARGTKPAQASSKISIQSVRAAYPLVKARMPVYTAE